MKIVFTKHVHDKLKEDEAKKLGITAKHIKEVLKNPIVADKLANPPHSVGKFTEELSLSVIWKVENSHIKVITFYPAGKGRYESKILRGR